MLASVDRSDPRRVEPARVVWLRRLLDGSLAGCAFFAGMPVVPAGLFLVPLAVAAIGLHLHGVRVLRRTALDVPLLVWLLVLVAGGLSQGGVAEAILGTGAQGVWRIASCLPLVGAIGDARRGLAMAGIFVVAAALQGIVSLAGIELPALGGAPGRDAVAFVATAALAMLAAVAVAGPLPRPIGWLLLLVALPVELGRLAAGVGAASRALVGGIASMVAVGRRGLRAAAIVLLLLGAGAAAFRLAASPTPAAAVEDERRERALARIRAYETLAEAPALGSATSCRGAGRGAAAGPCRAGDALVSVWAQAGPLGLIACVWLFASAIGALRSGIKRRGEERIAASLLLGAAGVAGAFLFWAPTADLVYDPTSGWALALCLSIGLAVAGGSPPRSPVAEEGPSPPRGSAAVAAIASSLAILGGLSALEQVGRGEAVAAGMLLAALALGHAPGPLPGVRARLRGLCTLAGAAVLVARAFPAVAPPGTEAWWATPSSLAAVAALVAGLAGAAWALRRPGEVGAAVVAGALTAGWLLLRVGIDVQFVLPSLGDDADPARPDSFNFALGAAAAALVFVAWAGPLGFGERPVLGIARPLQRLPSVAVGVGLAAIAVAGLV